ncbi:metallophosphoesterase [Lachnospiraceae bacterium 62-35]
MKNRRFFVKTAAATLLVAASFHMQGCGKKQDINGIETTPPGKGEENGSSEESNIENESSANVMKEEEKGRTENNRMSREGGEQWEDRMEQSEEEEAEAGDLEPLDGPKIIIGTDIHYLSSAYTDYGEAFQNMVNYGDGRIVTYIEQITEEFLNEVIEENPAALILTGDLTSNGEKKSHEALAEKLRRVEDEGITVLVIPGNHDVNNRSARGYRGNETYPVEFTSPQDFARIYGEFGYEEAASRDEESLSYVYQLDENTRLLMLDTCQYHEGFARVGGAIMDNTYSWIEEQLEDAWNNDMDVIPAAHHNLLDQSEVYVEDCTIEHSSQLIEILEGWEISLFLSGHLHVQHMEEREGDYPLREIVTSSLTTPDCQYGVLIYQDKENYDYSTKKVDVEKWARENHSTKMDLLEFRSFCRPFLRQVFYNQAYKVLKDYQSITEDEMEMMCHYYAELNDYYYQGRAFKVRESARKDPAFLLWEEYAYQTVLNEYIISILDDAVNDYNKLYVRDGETIRQGGDGRPSVSESDFLE